MIRTQEEYNNACNFIDSDMELYDFQLSEKMSSYEYNLYLQDTEYFLNFLYEKIRTLEELCDYLDEYVDTKLRQADRAIQIEMPLLDISASTFQNTIDILPDWNRTTSVNLYDRDGTALSVANYTGHVLEPASRKDIILEPQLIIKKETNQAHKDNLTSAIQDKVYLTSYQRTNWEPIEETVHVTVPIGADFNCVDITPINCDITVAKTEDGISITMDPERYDKELRNFDYLSYTGSNLTNILYTEAQYAPDQSVIANQTKQNNAYNQQLEKQYISDILYRQQISADNTQKAITVNT